MQRHGEIAHGERSLRTRVARAAVCTRRGPARPNNSDQSLVRDDLGVYVLADGDGVGTPAEAAAAAAVRGAERVLVRWAAHRDLSPVRAALRAVETANAELWRVSTSQTAYPKMTAAGAALLLDRGQAVFVGVGDVALFRWRAKLLSRIVVAAWLADERLGDGPRLELEPVVMDLAPGDTFLMASDGLNPALVRPGELGAALAQRDPRLAAEYVVALALDRGGVDDTTAVVVRVDGDA